MSFACHAVVSRILILHFDFLLERKATIVHAFHVMNVLIAMISQIGSQVIYQPLNFGGHS